MQQPGPEEAAEPELASAAAAAAPPLPPPLERNDRAVAREITPPPPPPAEELDVFQFLCSASTQGGKDQSSKAEYVQGDSCMFVEKLLLKVCMSAMLLFS